MYLTLFEKIFCTLGVVNVLMFLAGMVVQMVWEKSWSLFLILPLCIQFVVSIILLIVVELVLCGIWNMDIHVFPSLFD
jgi:hypothetical protein